MTIEEEVQGTLEHILRTHHYYYKSFEEAKIHYITENRHEIVYDAMSLFIYSHTMDANLYFQFSNHLRKKYHELFNAEDKKRQREYEVLLLFFGIHTEYEKGSVTHIDRPDFEVITNTGKKVGIEVTQFVTEEDSVQNAIMREYFGRGMSAEEIKNNAVKWHGRKALKYRYSEFESRVCISSPIKSASPEYFTYAKEITSKLKKYKQIKDRYDKFIVLCDGRHPIFVSSRYDTEQIMENTKALYPDECGVDVAIIRYSEQSVDEQLHIECDVYSV